MPHVAKACRAARAQLRPLHHPGVQLDDAVGVQARPDAGVEQGLVLHVAHRRDGRGQRALTDAGPTGVTRALDGGLAQRLLGLGNGPGAAVDDQRRTGQ